MKSLTEVLPQSINSLTLNEKLMHLEIYNKLEPDELKVYSALETMSVGRCSPIEVKEHLKTCIALSGCQTPTIELFQFLCEFVIKNYGNYKLKELGVAFELYAMGKLSVDKAITFNPKFFGDVMSAYKPISIQVRNKTYTQPPALDIPKINDNEIIEALYQNWDKSTKKDWKLLNIMAFDILWKRKDLNTTNLSKDVAEKIKAKVIAYYKVNAKTDKELERLTDELFIKNECKRYSLYLYLQNQL
jgi:hypothetical protein